MMENSGEGKVGLTKDYDDRIPTNFENSIMQASTDFPSELITSRPGRQSKIEQPNKDLVVKTPAVP